MPHVSFVPLSGFRVREERVRELGMSLPGFRQRRTAIAQLPALGLLTLAGLLPDSWTCSYHPATVADEALADRLAEERPALVALSALTASVEEAYRFSRMLSARHIPTVLGGLHATTCPTEATQYCDAVVVGDGEPA